MSSFIRYKKKQLFKNNTMKSLLTVLLFFGFFGFLYAQDASFSQYNSAPSLLNPSLIGQMQGEQQNRLLYNYSNKWWGSISETSWQNHYISYDRQVNLKKDKLGIGGSFLSDRFARGSFSNNSAMFSTAYHKYLFENQTISFGGSVSFNQRSVEPQVLARPGRPLMMREQFNFVSANLGLLWTFKEGKNDQFTLGVAFYHLNRPNVSFVTNQENLLPVRMTLHSTYQISINNKWHLEPSVAFSVQGQGRSLLFGNLMQRKLNKIVGGQLRFGTYAEISGVPFSENSPSVRRIVLLIGGQYKQIVANLSYDTGLHFSRVSSFANSRRGVELSLGWQF